MGVLALDNLSRFPSSVADFRNVVADRMWASETSDAFNDARRAASVG